MSTEFIQPSADFLDALARDEQAMPEVFAERPQRYANEPYRRKLVLMQRRIEHNLARLDHHLEGASLPEPDHGYRDEGELLPSSATAMPSSPAGSCRI